MGNNIFLDENKKLTLTDYMNFSKNGRENLGNEIPISVYRLMEYSIREELISSYGEKKQIEIFRNAGFRAGVYYAENFLNLQLPLNEFISQLQKSMAEQKIGVLRIESLDPETGTITLTVAEDTDCSGLPLLGETVCNYDEGFLGGILSTYTKKPYIATEIDCWATGDRICRFKVEVKDIK